LALLAFCQLVTAHGHAFVLRHAEFWIYPAQTILCGALLLWFRRCYEFHRLKNVGLTLLIAFAVFVLWIAPQQFFHFAPRTIGFDPEILGKNRAVYWSTISFRFLRLVVVVPLMEEIFWRGFLLRFVIDEHFERVPFGKFTWPSFAIVTLAFTFSHSRPDWPSAFIAGALYNVVAYRTRSLASCVLAHVATNLLLGCWVMQTHQWGFW
jgi:CAAX protease family protein